MATGLLEARKHIFMIHVCFLLLSFSLLYPPEIFAQRNFSPRAQKVTDKNEESSRGAVARPYFDEPVGQLVEHIPELRTLQPAPDQRGLPIIPQNVGRSVQEQSKFRYLGEEKIESQDTYVLAFAQQPGATFTVGTTGTGGKQTDMLMQGILWVDKNNFQIVRLRTDLLVPNQELRLNSQITKVAFADVKLRDLPKPLWLPSKVDVYMKVGGQEFRNVHQYKNYRRYRVSVKIGDVEAENSSTATTSIQENAGARSKAVKETEKALHALQQNKLDDAQHSLGRALAADPNSADGNYLMGLLLLRRKESNRAVGYLQKSLELSPNHSDALLALGEAQYLEHEYPSAIVSLENFLSEEPRSPQAPDTRKYIDAIRKLVQQQSVGESGVPDPSPSVEGMTKVQGGSAGFADQPLPPLPEVTLSTDASWAPPDVDSEKLNLESSESCQLDEVMQSVSQRVQELVLNVDRYTATENIEHVELSPMGLTTSREVRRFNYVVEIRPVGKSDLDVNEYRSGWMPTEKIRGYPDRTEFPGNIATVGIPMLALIFHPDFQGRYDFSCDGRSSWQGRSAWVIRFQQRPGRANSMLTYHMGGRSIAVELKGLAWIDMESSQVVAIESDILHPVPEIQLSRDHQLVEYGPVHFQKKSLELWLPKRSDWYCEIVRIQSDLVAIFHRPG